MMGKKMFYVIAILIGMMGMILVSNSIEAETIEDRLNKLEDRVKSLELKVFGPIKSISKDISGTYVHRNNINEYMELKSDGTYFVKIRGVGMHGKYEIDGDILTFKGQWVSNRAKVQGNTIKFEQDETWFSNTLWVKK